MVSSKVALMGGVGTEATRAVGPRKLQLLSLSAAAQYGLSVVSVSIALGTALFLRQFHSRNVEVPLFLFAIAVSAWYGGTGSAVLALVLATASFDYFFTEPYHTLSISLADLPYFVAFASFALLVAWFSSVRRRVEEQLRSARDRLQIEVQERTQQASLLDLTHDSIFVRGLDFVITYWNQGAQELYGWTAADAVGKRSDDLLQTVFPEPLETIRAQFLQAGRWEGELTRTNAAGQRVIVASRWSVRSNELGRPIAILETSNDITDRKRREQEIEKLNQQLAKRTTELESSNRELEAFAYSISHDLRAPLRHMSGFTELLQKSTSGGLNEKGQRYLTVIMDAAKRMGNLIDDLLGFSRIGRAETHKTTVNLDQLVQEALAEVRPDTAGRDIVWKTGPMPVWYCDRAMLRLVFVNLVSNAVKFTRPRSPAEIEIGCTSGNTDAKEVILFIRDNGVGFDMKYVNKLFGVFQRLHTSEAFEGTGIGLATVQRIVHRHGGRVWAEGLVDKGSTFYFSLSKPHGA